MISPDDLKKLAELSRVELSAAEAEPLGRDLEHILAYMEELKGVPTDGVLPMTGGTFEENRYRADEGSATALPGEAARGAFPASKDGYLEVPPVFGENSHA